MSDMVRRVARVLCSISGLNPNEHSLGKPQWQAYEIEALRIIAAMRKPTAEMVEAGLRELNVQGAGEHGLSLVYTAMIDAVLKGVHEGSDEPSPPVA